MHRPVLSIIGTIFNQAKLAERSLDIWCRQNFDLPYEIIILDDGSRDNTREMVAGYERKYPHLIRYFYFNEPGFIRNCTLLFNTAIRKLMRSDIAVIQWYDRIPSTFDALRYLFEPHLKYDRILVSFLTRHISGSSSRDIIDESILDHLMQKLRWRKDPMILKEIIGVPGAHCHPQTMNESACFSIKKKHFYEVNGYDERYYKVANYSNVELYGRLKKNNIHTLILDHYTFHQPHKSNRKDIQTQIEPENVIVRNTHIRQNWGSILPENMIKADEYELTIVTDGKFKLSLDGMPVPIELIVDKNWNQALYKSKSRIIVFISKNNKKANTQLFCQISDIFKRNSKIGCVGLTGGSLTLHDNILRIKPTGHQVDVVDSAWIAVRRRSAVGNGLEFCDTGIKEVDCIDFSLQMRIWGGRKNYVLNLPKSHSIKIDEKFMNRWKFLRKENNIYNHCCPK